MGRSKETFSKKEKEKKRLKKRQDKEAKMEERRANGGTDGSLESMLAYVDENGNLSATPPDPKTRKEINLEDIQLGAAASRADEAPEVNTGVLESFFHDKGFGFIKDADRSRNVFVHISALGPGIEVGTRVSYDIEQTPKGFSAVNVVKFTEPRPAPPPPPPAAPPADPA
jgi:cold shock CspA family protein